MSKKPISVGELLRQGVGIPAIALALSATFVAASPAVAAVVVGVSTSDALPGGTLTLQVRVDRAAGDPAIAGAQADLILSTAQLQVMGVCSSDQSACENGTNCPEQGRCVPSCQADARLTQHSLAAALPDFQNVPSGSRRLRLPINPDLFPPPTLEDGLLVTCTFAVLPGAALGPVDLTADLDRFAVTDDGGVLVASTLELHAGSIVSVLSTVTPTSTETPTEATATATIATPTEGIATVTPTEGEPTVTATAATPTETPTPETTTAPTVTETVLAVPTATSTTIPGPATPTRTNTAAAPTSTPIEPTQTATVESTATRTAAVGATATPTSAGQGGSVRDDDGCAMAPRDADGFGLGVGILGLPMVVLLLRRRKNCK